LLGFLLFLVLLLDELFRRLHNKDRPLFSIQALERLLFELETLDLTADADAATEAAAVLLLIVLLTLAAHKLASAPIVGDAIELEFVSFLCEEEINLKI
jgi:hypothetical protein